MNHDPALRPAFASPDDAEAVSLADAGGRVLAARVQAAPAPPWQVRDSNGPGLAGPVPTQGSGDVVSLGRSDGFSEVPAERAGAGPWPFYCWES